MTRDDGVGLIEWLTRDLGGGDLIEDLGEIAAGGDSDGRWSVTARLRRARKSWVLQLALDRPDSADPDGAFATVWFQSVERLIEPFSDVGWRVAAGHQAGSDPGSRLTMRLVGLLGLEIVHRWPDVGDDSAARGRRVDLMLLRRRDGGSYHLFLLGPNAGHGLWPTELADAVLRIAPELRNCCHATPYRVG